jgi:hypothetical protein
MQLGMTEAKRAILEAFIKYRLDPNRRHLRLIQSDSDGLEFGPSTREIADCLGISPPRLTRQLTPLMKEGKEPGLIGGVLEGGFQWWYDGPLDDLIEVKPELRHVIRSAA